MLSLKSVRKCLDDQYGGLVLSFDKIFIEDKDWIKYNSLNVNNSLKSIDFDDLPNDFCDAACTLVDEFRRKTVNEKVEWMMYFDYETGEVLYCWSGEKNRSGGNFNKVYLMGRKVASIHSHPKGCYSFPSPDNFDILENDFEDYELITSERVFWLIEFKGNVDESSRRFFQYNLGKSISEVMLIIKLTGNVIEIDEKTEEVISNYLLNGIDKKMNDIALHLTKKELI
jgi:hypothetical protein